MAVLCKLVSIYCLKTGWELFEGGGGTLRNIVQGSRSDLEKAARAIDNGHPIGDVVEDLCGSYIRNYKGINQYQIATHVPTFNGNASRSLVLRELAKTIFAIGR